MHSRSIDYPPTAHPACYNPATNCLPDPDHEKSRMTPIPIGDTPPPDQEPERPDDGGLRRSIIHGGRWSLEIWLRPRPGEPQDPAEHGELLNQDGEISLDQIAHFRLHLSTGATHEIEDPEVRATFLAYMRDEVRATFRANMRDMVSEPDPLIHPQNRAAAPQAAFPEGLGTIPTNPAVFTTISAIWKGGQRARELTNGWTSRPDGQPVYQYASTHGGIISVYIQPGRGTLATADTLWALVERLSPFTADVALAVLAQLCAPEIGSGPQYPMLEPIRITADTILSYKGIQRWGSERAELRQRIAAEIEHLRHLSFDVKAWPVGSFDDVEIWPVGSREPPQEDASWHDDTLFDIVTVERSGRGQAANISWSVRAGHWAYWWFNASGRVFVGRMARALLELDHRENRGAAILAKKIGQLVLLQAGSDRQSRLAVIVSTLLTDIGELPVEKARTKDWAGRTRDRLDDALLSLLEAGIFVHIDWPDGYGPSDEDRQRGWVDHWLAARIELSLAMPMAPNQITDQPPAELLLQTPDVIPESAPMEEAPISGQMIRRARAARKWKQEQLARYLSISVPYLSQIEGDRRQPSPQLSARLRTWLAEPDA